MQSDLKYGVVKWVKILNQSILTMIYQDLTAPPFVECTHVIAEVKSSLQQLVPLM